MSAPARASGFEPASHRSITEPPPVNGSSPTVDIDPSNNPGGAKSLAGISLRAFLLGVTLGTGLCLTVVAHAVVGTPLWRVPFFLAALSLFHFLEYFVTARHNPPQANISAFLLSSNGWQYNVAHGSALAECLLAWLFPDASYNHYFTRTAVAVQVTLGLALMALGQTVRTLAMAHAGRNFNHTVQVQRRAGHTLTTTGVYRVLRHPSYFGFFWWGLGTQLVLGNVVCLLAYAVVLWVFFSRRIQREEKYLILFFGDEYVEYRRRTWVGIPGIR
ncbi:hypothetical protein VTN02DRAFT_2363 [Thermoascus thermophilus]